MKIRVMKKRDWKKCLELWQNIPGMGLNSIDDTKEGIVRFLRRNPKTCFVAETDGTFAGTIIAGHDGRRGYIYPEDAESQPPCSKPQQTRSKNRESQKSPC